MRRKIMLMMLFGCFCGAQAQKNVTMLVGTYTDGGSKGIYSYKFNQKTGLLTDTHQDIHVSKPVCVQFKP